MDINAVLHVKGPKSKIDSSSSKPASVPRQAGITNVEEWEGDAQNMQSCIKNITKFTKAKYFLDVLCIIAMITQIATIFELSLLI